MFFVPGVYHTPVECVLGTALLRSEHVCKPTILHVTREFRHAMIGCTKTGRHCRSAVGNCWQQLHCQLAKRLLRKPVCVSAELVRLMLAP
jgi:hypothetical protein